MNPTDPSSTWSGLMQFGFGVLRLSSKDFWFLSLPELEAALRIYQVDGPHPMSRLRLDQLMRAHPDQPEEAL